MHTEIGAPKGQRSSMEQPLSSTFATLVDAFEEQEAPPDEKTIAVNPLISKVASWYEKLRNVMDYREEEVILRAAIERILKRRLLLGGSGKTVAEPLVRELVWARYFPDNTLSESVIEKVRQKVDLFLSLRHKILSQNHFPDATINEWTYHLMSSSISYLLNPQRGKEVMATFVYKVMREQLKLLDDDEETRDVQVFIAVRRAFARDDVAFLRYQIFGQYFGKLTEENAEEVAARFRGGYKEMQRQLAYPRKDSIYSFVRGKMGAFFILEDVLRTYRGNIREFAKSREELGRAVFTACDRRYQEIGSKVRRAIVRSFIFILLTKAFFAVFVEGAIEQFLYGEVLWRSILLNTTAAPLLMVVIGLFIQAPGRKNSERILAYITTLMFDEEPRLGQPLLVHVAPQKESRFDSIFTVLWLLSFILAFGFIVFVLTRLSFHLVSQGIFIFFLAIVSFLSYRIALTSRAYTVDGREGLVTPIIDFLFMPIIKVGRQLTLGISQLNVILFVFDFIIEAPFKGLFSFFEQWFTFLHRKREELE